MLEELTTLNGRKAIGITFTEKPVTAWGGLALMVAFAERIGLAPKLAKVPPLHPHVVERHLARPHPPRLRRWSARQFAQLALLGVDEPVHRLFGLRRYPSTATFTRFFRRFTTWTVTSISEPLFQRCVARLPGGPRATRSTSTPASSHATGSRRGP